jgi:Zn-dependent peptidase ImmA (M78 family)
VFDLALLQPAANEVERTCNRIAAEFLVPTKMLERHLPQALKQED